MLLEHIRAMLGHFWKQALGRLL